MENYFQLNEYFFLARELQLILILAMFVATTYQLYLRKYLLSKPLQKYSYYFAFMFAPIYEEIIFRGLIFAGLSAVFNVYEGLIFSSITFGFWHMKNIFYSNLRNTIPQMLYTGLIYGPLFAVFTYMCESIWPVVIFHYFNNLVFLMQIKVK